METRDKIHPSASLGTGDTRFGRVGVLAGGPSSEREISLRSGKAVYNALLQEGVEAIFLDVKDDIYDIIKKNKIDIAFIALHGRFGEDGTVQKILGELDVPYTGSGPEASRLSLDKIAAKKIFKAKGIPTPRYMIFERDGLFNIEEALSLGIPLVVKPQSEGSSIGLSVVREKGGLVGAIDKAFRYGPRILLEEYIDGRELTVGILDDEPLPVIEIVTKARVYDYTAKYNDPETKYVVPASIDSGSFKNAQRTGKRSHLALGCNCLSRVDMIMDGRGGIFVLEVNAIPGMTERSLLPKAAAASGLNFNGLCVKLIENAIGKYEKTKKI